MFAQPGRVALLRGRGGRSGVQFGFTLFRNFRLLWDPSTQARLLALAEAHRRQRPACADQEVLLLLINGLLGWAGAQDRLATVELRQMSTRGSRPRNGAVWQPVRGQSHRAQAEQSAVFRRLGGFRIGQETTNALDGLLILEPPIRRSRPTTSGSSLRPILRVKCQV